MPLKPLFTWSQSLTHEISGCSFSHQNLTNSPALPKQLSVSFTLVWVGRVKTKLSKSQGPALWCLSVGCKLTDLTPFLPEKTLQHKKLPDSADGLLHLSQPYFVLWDEAKWSQLICLVLYSLLWDVFFSKSKPNLCFLPGALDWIHYF